MPFTDVRSLIVWIIESGGAGILSYWVLAQLEKGTKVKEWPGEWKRALAVAQAVVIGAIIALLGGLIRVYPSPQDAAGWANLMITVGITAAVSHQLTHGFHELPGRHSA